MLTTPETDKLYMMNLMSKNSNKFRSQVHLGYVRTQPCMACGSNQGVQAHHVRRKKPGHLKSLGSRVSDQYTVPLCHDCHTLLHQPNRSEDYFWDNLCPIDPFLVAEQLYNHTINKLGIKDE